MQVEVAVHSVLRNHGVAESTLIRAAAAAAAAAALRRRQLCPHVTCITQLRAPERLQSRANQRKQCIIHALNNPYTHSVQALGLQVSVALRRCPLSSQASAQNTQQH